MPNILLIESSTPSLSVGLLGFKEKTLEESLFDNISAEESKEHAALLMPFVNEILSRNSVKACDLDAIAVGKGPGSYTGLRIGLSSAKGLCYGLNIPLIGISPLEAMALEAAQRHSDCDIFVSSVDAGRMEVYSAVYKKVLDENQNIWVEELSPAEALVLNQDSYQNYRESRLCFVGSGSEKSAKAVCWFEPSLHSFDENILPSTSIYNRLSMRSFSEKKFEDVAYFCPMYIKNFVAGKAQVKGLGL